MRPVLVELPWLALPLHSYGAMLGLSLLVGWFLTMRLAVRDGIAAEAAGGIYVWTALWSIVGARLLYVVVQHDRFESLAEVVLVRRGGLVAYGGMIGGVLASAWACRRRRVPLLQWADAAAPAVVLGTALTRVGCLLYGCDYGKPTEASWAVRFPDGSPAWQDHVATRGLPADASLSLPVHPTQLYEALGAAALFVGLLWLRARRRYSGQVFLAWVIGYGLFRPVVELFRDDKQRGGLGPLSTSQLIGILAASVGIALLPALARRARRDPAAARLWERPCPAPPEGGIKRPQREPEGP